MRDLEAADRGAPALGVGEGGPVALLQAGYLGARFPHLGVRGRPGRVGDVARRVVGLDLVVDERVEQELLQRANMR